MNEKIEKYAEGHSVGIWMCIFIALFSVLAIPISIITDNYVLVASGPALGVAIGTAIGQSIENKYKLEGRIRSLNKSEQKRIKYSIASGIVILTIGVLVFMLFYIFNI